MEKFNITIHGQFIACYMRIAVDFFAVQVDVKIFTDALQIEILVSAGFTGVYNVTDQAIVQQRAITLRFMYVIQ